MIEEQYVSFETAKLLKEAGFDVPCTSQYTEGMGVWNVECTYDFNHDDFGYSRPTQSLAAKWLREVHHINVYACFDYAEFDERKWFFMREHTMINDDSAVYCSITSYNSYGEAFEAGLREAIKLIKK